MSTSSTSSRGAAAAGGAASSARGATPSGRGKTTNRGQPAPTYPQTAADEVDHLVGAEESSADEDDRADEASAAEVSVASSAGAEPIDESDDEDDLERRLLAIRARKAAASASAPPTRSPRVAGRPASGPDSTHLVAKSPYREKYKGDSGLALDSWITAAKMSRAFYTGMTDAQAVRWLAPALEEAALDWYATLDEGGNAPTTPQALFDGLRKRFQPVNARETARRGLDKLRQGKDSVNEYTSKFNRLIAALPNESEESRIFAFRRGLSDAIEERVASAEPPPATLESTIAYAARVEGRSASRETRSEGLSLAEASSSGPRFGLDELNAYAVAAVRKAMNSLNHQPRYETRQDRGANKRAPGAPLSQHFGVSEEVLRKRFDENLCMHCAGKGHYKRDCPDFKAGKPVRSN